MADDLAFRDKIKADLKREEGCIPHMYLDTRGYVTVGVGHMLPDVQAAQSLRFEKRDTGEAATPQDIAADFESVKQQPPGRVASYYESATALQLPMAVIEAQLDEQIEHFETALRDHLGNYDGFPAEAKQALLDMAFNLGASGLLRKFPKLVAGAQAGKWDICAAECRRKGIGDTRNEATRALFEKATLST